VGSRATIFFGRASRVGCRAGRRVVNLLVAFIPGFAFVFSVAAGNPEVHVNKSAQSALGIGHYLTVAAGVFVAFVTRLAMHDELWSGRLRNRQYCLWFCALKSKVKDTDRSVYSTGVLTCCNCAKHDIRASIATAQPSEQARRFWKLSREPVNSFRGFAV
jgi:hypothetical protein